MFKLLSFILFLKHESIHLSTEQCLGLALKTARHGLLASDGKSLLPVWLLWKEVVGLRELVPDWTGLACPGWRGTPFGMGTRFSGGTTELRVSSWGGCMYVCVYLPTYLSSSFIKINRRTTLLKRKLHSVTTWWIYISRNDHSNKFRVHPSSCIVTKQKNYLFFPLWKELLGFTLTATLKYTIQQC